jgi:hypothetical protein
MLLICQCALRPVILALLPPFNHSGCEVYLAKRERGVETKSVASQSATRFAFTALRDVPCHTPG